MKQLMILLLVTEAASVSFIKMFTLLQSGEVKLGNL